MCLSLFLLFTPLYIWMSGGRQSKQRTEINWLQALFWKRNQLSFDSRKMIVIGSCKIIMILNRILRWKMSCMNRGSEWKKIIFISTNLHLVLRFWNQVLTWASVILRDLASVALSADARYFCLWNRFSSSQICILVNEVRGFFLFGGVLFWYGCPILLGGNGGSPARPTEMEEEKLVC